MLLLSKSIRLLLPIALAAVCGAQSFTILTKGVSSAVEVRYFLTGSFGGYGSFVRHADQDDAYRIPLVPDLRQSNVEAAEKLRAIIWAPGCQIDLITVESITDANRTATYECRPLSTIALTGTISPPPTSPGPRGVEVHYMAFWDHKFFGIADGMVTDLLIAKAPMDTGGRFQIRIPDFSHDRVTAERQEACLEIRLIENKSWNPVVVLLPPVSLRYKGADGLKILSDYGAEIPFDAAR